MKSLARLIQSLRSELSPGGSGDGVGQLAALKHFSSRYKWPLGALGVGGVALAVSLPVYGSITSQPYTDHRPTQDQPAGAASSEIQSHHSQSDNEPAPRAQASTHSTTRNSSDKQSASSQVSVSVNGKRIAVPENGHIHKVIKNDDGQTVVDIQTNQSSSDGSSYSQSHSTIVTTSSTGGTVTHSSR